jgi:hypothetical protein
MIDDVITAIPFSYSSFGKSWIVSAMMKTLGLLQRFGSIPSDPTPRVTTARM